MKKNNRKGFTIVELVIVIAVIAILATVLVPTFGGIIEKAQNSKTIQEAKNIYTNYSLNHADDAAGFNSNVIVEVGGKYVAIVDGTVVSTVFDALDSGTGAATSAFTGYASNAALPACSGHTDCGDIYLVTLN